MDGLSRGLSGVSAVPCLSYDGVQACSPGRTLFAKGRTHGQHPTITLLDLQSENRTDETKRHNASIGQSKQLGQERWISHFAK